MNGTGTTLLHMACEAERPEAEILATVQLLLNKGAHPLAVDARGRTPGDISKERGHASVTVALTLRAAALEQNGTVGKGGFRPQVLNTVTAAELDAALASYASVSRPDPLEPIPPSASSFFAAARGPKRTGLKFRPGLSMEMQKAAESGDLHRLEECVREGDAAHPNAPAGFGTDAWVPALWLAAHEASMAGRMRVVKCLVEEMGVRVHRLLPEEKELLNGSTELTAAPSVYGDQEAVALYLVRAGAERGDIDVGHVCGADYHTLLFMAVVKNVSARLLTALMETGGFDPGAPDSIKATPLARAAGFGKIGAMDTMLAYARRHGRLESAFRCCMAPEGGVPPLFMMVMEARELGVLKHLVATVRQEEVPGFDLFHYAIGQACDAHFAPALRFLLAPERAADWGQPPNVDEWVSDYGETLLHLAFSSHADIIQKRKPGEILGTVELLLEKGVDPTIKDD
jgi:ankyrin repeat protein